MNAKIWIAAWWIAPMLTPGSAYALSIVANPPYTPLGGRTTLSWNVPDATSCMVTSNGYNLWGGTNETVDSGLYGGNMNDTVYTLTCTMADGSQQSAQLTVPVRSSQGSTDSLSITADPPYTAIGGHTTLTWNVTNASSCMVTANGYDLWGGTSETVDTGLYGGNWNDTVYTLTCAMSDGSRQTAQVTVLVPVGVPASDFTFNAMKGGNLFDGDFWFSNGPTDAPIARQMNLNFVRINVNMAEAVQNGTQSQLLDDLTATMDAYAAENIKVILVFGGYIEYGQACGPYLSFLDVQPLAQQIVDTFRGHPALYAWELMNEAYSTMDDGYGCDHQATNQAVHAMFQLVHTADPSTPTTVSEAWYWWYLPTWTDVSSFASFHIYPQATSPLTEDQIASDQELLATNIDEARGAAGSLPLMMGEFGVTGLSPDDAAAWYQGMYATLKSKDIGSFFWNLSATDAAYGVLNSDGSPTSAGQAIESELE